MLFPWYIYWYKGGIHLKIAQIEGKDLYVRLEEKFLSLLLKLKQGSITTTGNHFASTRGSSAKLKWNMGMAELRGRKNTVLDDICGQLTFPGFLFVWHNTFTYCSEQCESKSAVTCQQKLHNSRATT